MSKEIRVLAASGNKKLILHALKRWGKDLPLDPEPLFSALKNDDPEILQVVLPLATKHFPALFIPQVLELLQHSQFMHRRLAVEALQPAMGKQITDRFLKLLGEETHPHVLASAVLAVPRLGLEVGLLSRFLQHPDTRVRANCIRAFSAIPGEHRALLEPLLKDTVLRVQSEAIKCLVRFIPEDKLEDLMVKRLESTKSGVRSATVMLLADLPLRRRLPLLKGVLRDPDPKVASCAARAIARGSDLQGYRALAELYLVPAPENEAVDPEKRPNYLLKLLRSIPPEGLVIEAEKHGQPAQANPDIIASILEVALDNPQWEAFLPWAIGGLSRKETRVRLLALQIVRQHLSFFAGNLEELLAKVDQSRQPSEQAMVAQIRLEAGQMKGLETLKTMLRDSDSLTRQAAAQALRQTPNLVAKGVLQEAQKAGIAEAFSGLSEGETKSPTETKLDPIDLPDS